MTHFNSKSTLTTNTNYSCHIKVVYLLSQLYEIHITMQAIYSLGGGEAHTHTQTHIDIPHRINFNKPGMPG